jgi:hypothetical protein
MRRYAPGPFLEMEVLEEFTLEEWPSRRAADVAWMYIALEGDGFEEAVAAIVTPGRRWPSHSRSGVGETMTRVR